MSYKTILVHCDASPKLSQRLDVAVDLAQRHRAHLVGAHLQAPMDIPAFAGGGVMPMHDFFAAYEANAKADRDKAAAAFTNAIKGTHLATEWRVAQGYPEDELAIQAAMATYWSSARPILRASSHAARSPGIAGNFHWTSSAGDLISAFDAGQIGHVVLEREPREARSR